MYKIFHFKLLAWPCQSKKLENKRNGNISQGQKPFAPTRLPEVLSKL
jgi:hypothetical protein